MLKRKLPRKAAFFYGGCIFDLVKHYLEELLE